MYIQMAHTTLSIDKKIYQRTAKRAKKQHLSVSAVARMLLEAYAAGRINVLAIQTVEPVEIREIPDHEITPEMRKAAEEAYNTPRSKLTNFSL
jgi:predicted CopG family antitoxin